MSRLIQNCVPLNPRDQRDVIEDLYNAVGLKTYAQKREIDRLAELAKKKSMTADAGIKEVENKMQTMWRVEKLDNHGSFCIIFQDGQKMFYNENSVDFKHLQANAKMYAEMIAK